MVTGVDLADELVSFCRTPFKSKKWYTVIFAHLSDVCNIIVWLLYRLEHEILENKALNMDLGEFRDNVANCLIMQNRAPLMYLCHNAIISEI